MTEPVVLTMSLPTYSGKAVTFYNSLETFTLRSTHNVYIRCVCEYIGNRKSVAELKLLSEIRLELDEFALRCGPCLFKMPLQRLAGMLLADFVIGKLYSGITIILYSFSTVRICVTTHGPASITVHGIFFPSAPKTEVIPIFFPINPGIGLFN